jgi:major membrane immunogen (membrane-anchored lipoprotein)
MMKKLLLIVAIAALGLMVGCSGEGKTDIKATDGAAAAETAKPGEAAGVPEGEK